MQTFLPYANFVESVKVLDWKRLGKQRVECKQIYKALTTGKGWVHHPATIMWRGYEKALALYWAVACLEWRARGYKDSLYIEAALAFSKAEGSITLPWWLGYEPLHASHRSNLLRKDSAFYGKFGWREHDRMDYLWPKPDGKTVAIGTTGNFHLVTSEGK
jgi:hypothetical protein